MSALNGSSFVPTSQILTAAFLLVLMSIPDFNIDPLVCASG